ncbi:phasin family protein [Sulfitobacter aestuariivivens]|uniref:Phasin family protein n=1 Tax=Sulfitobacter aestuariivivens TaxID=2766981 RepID=A0A927D5B6_9RHOB|nr:phasin family protein [Sulfitobacter aestuariivivens]MBD3665418.1 phasin family protein [Sulfitobacter aestuariivivens]
MANKSPNEERIQTTEAPLSAVTQLQEAGLGSMMGMGTAWIEAVSDMSAEVAHFVAERIKEDVKTQHEILHCKNVSDLQHIQAQFIQKAMDQYQAETGKLVEMGTKAFAAKED